MTDLRAAAQQALEAMLNFPDDISDEMFESITALKAALAESVQEPEPGEYHGWVLREVLFDNGEPVGHREPVQEPVAWINNQGDLLRHAPESYGREDENWVPLYTAPPQRKPLTDEEILKLMNYRYVNHTIDDPDVAWIAEAAKKEVIESARAIERAHGIGGQDESA